MLTIFTKFTYLTHILGSKNSTCIADFATPDHYKYTAISKNMPLIYQLYKWQLLISNLQDKLQMKLEITSQYGRLKRILILFTPVRFRGSCLEFGRPPSSKYVALNAPRCMIVKPVCRTGASLWFGRPLKAARADRQR